MRFAFRMLCLTAVTCVFGVYGWSQSTTGPASADTQTPAPTDTRRLPQRMRRSLPQQKRRKQLTRMRRRQGLGRKWERVGRT